MNTFQAFLAPVDELPPMADEPPEIADDYLRASGEERRMPLAKVYRYLASLSPMSPILR